MGLLITNAIVGCRCKKHISKRTSLSLKLSLARPHWAVIKAGLLSSRFEVWACNSFIRLYTLSLEDERFIPFIIGRKHLINNCWAGFIMPHRSKIQGVMLFVATGPAVWTPAHLRAESVHPSNAFQMLGQC